MYTKTIKVLLDIPTTLEEYREELEAFIDEKLNNFAQLDIEVTLVDELSKDTQIVISLVGNTLGKFDESYYENYQNRAFGFLFYYFYDDEIKIDDFTDEVFERVEFKSKVERDSKLYSGFEEIDEIKRSLEVNLKEALFDIENKINYSKINASVISRSKGNKFYDNDNNLRKVDNF